MKHALQAVAAVAGLSLFSTVIFADDLADADVDSMSDIEVSEYAVRMAEVLGRIKDDQLCVSHDANCVRIEFARSGISYDDKALVQKRLAPMIGTIY